MLAKDLLAKELLGKDLLMEDLRLVGDKLVEVKEWNLFCWWWRVHESLEEVSTLRPNASSRRECTYWLTDP